VPLADSSQLVGLRLYLPVTVLLLYVIRTIPSLCHSIVLLLKYTQGWFKVLHYRCIYRRRCFLYSFSTAAAVFSVLLFVGTPLLRTSNHTHYGLLFVLFLNTLHSWFFFSSILSLSYTSASCPLPSAFSPSLLAGDCVAVILY
jgi:predicted ABC-type exoprotein transport system permease subunit